MIDGNQVRGLVSYIRVSTDRQGRSGLGEEAQRESIRKYAEQVGRPILREYVEVESGKNPDRPKLWSAIGDARMRNASLIVAKLDRMARNKSLFQRIMDGGADCIFLDLPQIPEGPAGRMMLGILAEVAEFEVKMIGQRTRDALRAAKARGKRLGAANPKCRKISREHAAIGRKAAAKARAIRAIERVEHLLPEVMRHWNAGLNQRAVSRALAADGIFQANGKPFHSAQIGRMIEMAQAIQEV